MVQFITLEGSISSGKSTILSHLKDIGEQFPNFFIVNEPVEQWTHFCDDKGKTIIECFYENQKEHAFTFQINACFTRFQALKEVYEKAKNYEQNYYKEAIILTERTLLTDCHVFTQMLKDSEMITSLQHQVYLNMFNELKNLIPITKAIYIKTNPSTCHNRINYRGRKGEDNISLKYLEKCHEYHEKFYINVLSQIKDHLVIENNNFYEDISRAPYMISIVNYIFD